MRRRRRRASILELFYGLMIVCLLAGGSLWLDRKGVQVMGHVAAKQERIVVGHEPSGDWDRYYEVGAEFKLPDGTSSQATVRVSPKRYDALHTGDPIAVRYLPQFPLLARTSDRSTASVARELAWGLAGIPVLVWLVGGLLALWVAARMGSVPVLAVGGGWIVAAYPLLFSPSLARGVPPGGCHGRGERRDPRGQGSRPRIPVPQPGREVQPAARSSLRGGRARIPVQDGHDTVLAVDAVDSGSVQGLVFGARLPVRLDPAAPREAQLAGATRRFAEANRYHFLIPVVGFAILGTLAGLAYGWRRKRHGKAREPDGVGVAA